MKINKFKKINLKINNKRKILFIILGLSIITIGITYGRYIYNDIKDYYLASKSFYFNSDKLTTGRAIYQIDNWSGVDPYQVTINLNIPGISYTIDDVSGRPYFNLSVTNTTDYYLVKESFDDYQVDQRIDYNTYMSLSEENKAKCALPLITLKFDPKIVILDMTNDAYQKAESYTTTLIDGHEYINSISFRINLESSKAVKFYKASANEDYTYPITNDESIVEFSYVH